MLHLARAVRQLQSEDATTLAYAAIALAFATRDYENTLRLLNRALSLNPSSGHAHGVGSIINVGAGHYDRSIELAERALRLSPLNPLIVMPLNGKAGVLLMKGDYEGSPGMYPSSVANITDPYTFVLDQHHLRCNNPGLNSIDVLC
jgi:adenylate cyclase